MKTRLDTFLVDNHYYTSRNKARLAIENGDISVNGNITNKVSFQVDNTDTIEIVKTTINYVSRGGLKLEKALNVFDIDVKDRVCLDIGASTGGFTDCLLKHGAKLVYALDVGTDQLVDSLKRNNKVISLENTNFRYIDTKEYKKYCLNFICSDVSFISLSYLFENVSKILDTNGSFVALIKPQFETQKKEHNKNGVVNDPKIHHRVIVNLMNEANKYGLYLNKLDYSPVKGEKSGNIEYLSLFSFQEKNINLNKVDDIIELSFRELR